MIKKLKYLKHPFYQYFKGVLSNLLYIISYKPLAKGNLTIIGISSGIENVDFEGNNAINYGSEFFGKIKIGYATTLGFHNAIHGNITIGKYCQIGANVAIHTNNHPMNHLSTYINSRLFDGELSKYKINKKVTIGNDVWIGHGVIILGDVDIGNGVIIAAGSVVNKNIPAYTIAAGVPAKVIKKRFNNHIIKEIENLKWWDKNKEELESIKPLFFKDLTKVSDLYSKES